jgi:hypothetical protein
VYGTSDINPWWVTFFGSATFPSCLISKSVPNLEINRKREEYDSDY